MTTGTYVIIGANSTGGAAAEVQEQTLPEVQ